MKTVGVLYKGIEKRFEDFNEAISYIEVIMIDENVSENDIEVKYYDD